MRTIVECISIRITLGTTALMWSLGGCSDPYPDQRIRECGSHAMYYYVEARQIYLAALSTPLTGPDLSNSLDEVAKRLRAADDVATHTDESFACPLFRTRLGLLAIERGREEVGTIASGPAYRQFERAVKPPVGCEEWVPGWLALAEWSIHEMRADSSKAQDADGYLTQARDHLKKLKDHSKGLKVRVSLVPDSHEIAVEKSDSPDLSEQRRLEILWRWVAFHEAWIDDQLVPTLVVDHSMQVQEAEVSVDRLHRRLMARIEYLRAQIQIRRNEPPLYVIERLNAALVWDEDFFPARLEMSAQNRVLQQWSRAEAWVRPYLVNEATHPAFRNNPRLWLEVARVYAGLDAERPSDESARHAERAFRRVAEDLNAADGVVFQEWARFYVTAARNRPNLVAARVEQFLHGAEICAESARVLGADASTIMNDVQRLRSQLGGHP